MRLLYKTPPPVRLTEAIDAYDNERLIWEKHSLPLGNGFIGANAYGYTEREDITICENSFCNPPEWHVLPNNPASYAGGLMCFAKLHIDFGHSKEEVTDYRRSLSLDEAIYRTEYVYHGARYLREIFTSYPSRVMACRLSASEGGRLSFTLRAEIPYIDDHCDKEGDGLVHTGSITLEDNDIVLRSTLEHYMVTCVGRLRLFTKGGSVSRTEDGFCVTGADEAYFIYAQGSNYRLEPRVFTEPDPKKKLELNPDGADEARALVDAASLKDYNALREEHIADHKELFGRVGLSFGADGEELTTDELVRLAQNGEIKPYLLSLLYQYGRYLLIASSRIGGLPSNLQGIWCVYRSSPWTAGYWHNINVQMNYWHACSSALPECFVPYKEYAEAYMPKAKEHADNYVKSTRPEAYGGEGNNGWIIGTGASPYRIEGSSGHSGPGTGAFTSLLFWDYYDYTRDKDYLREVAYPILYGMSLFFSRAVEQIDGKYLVRNSASPEQRGPDGRYYVTVGCAFDQQMIWENYKRTLEAAEALGIKEDPLLDTLREQIDHLDPVLVGKSGQIKEYREEEYYGDIGEYHHRHISHLVGLYPGTVINSDTPEWLEAAKVSLNLRGDRSTGWATAHRLCAWARARDPKRTLDVMHSFFGSCIPENLWDRHPPFQIDGNFGYTAAVAEMLVQSHAGYIDLLPTLPEAFGTGCFSGIRTRGGFSVDCEFERCTVKRAEITSLAGERLTVRGEWLIGTRVTKCGTTVTLDTDEYTAETAEGERIVFER